MKHDEHRAHVGFVTRLLEVSGKQGVSRSELLALAGIDAVILQNPNATIPMQKIHRLWQAAVEKTKDNALGLHVGEYIKPGFLNVVGYIIMTSQSMEDAFQSSSRYISLVCNVDRISLEVDKKEARVVYNIIDSTVSYSKYRVEASLTTIITFGNWITGQVIPVKKVYCMHREPEYSHEYQRIFKAPVEFESSSNTIVFYKQALDLPIIQADPTLCAQFNLQAKKMMEALSVNRHLTDQITGVLINKYHGNDPGVATVSRELAMSIRTLYRRLKLEKTTYKAISDKARKEVSIRLLSQPDMAIYEIAFLLGYAETSSFYRAFKRWTGKSPGFFRENIGAAH